MRKAIILLLCLILAGCAPSEEAVQRAIALTQTAAPTSTPLPATATPEPTPAQTLSPAEFEAGASQYETLINNLLQGMVSVHVVHWVRFISDGVIDIDLQTAWRAPDAQAQTHYEIIQMLSGFCTNSYQSQIEAATGVTDPVLKITTQSLDERYVYTSQTSFYDCVQVGFKYMNFDEWVKASGGALSDGSSH